MMNMLKEDVAFVVIFVEDAWIMELEWAMKANVVREVMIHGNKVMDESQKEDETSHGSSVTD